MSAETRTPAASAETSADRPADSAPSSTPTEKRPHPVHPDRWSDGTVRAGFPGPALVTGAFSRLQFAQREAERAQALADMLKAITAPTPVEQVWARLFVEADQIVKGYMRYLDEQDGPIASRGRQRAAVAGRRQEVAQLLDLGSKLQSAITRKPEEQPGAALTAYLAGRSADEEATS